MTKDGATQYRSQMRLAVLLLAAGEGSRLGSRPKALLKKEGKTLIERSLEAVRSFAPVEFILLTGFHAELIEAELKRFREILSCPITIVRNENPERGQYSSIRLGLESLKSDFDALLVCLSDQPQITHLEIGQLVGTFEQRAADKQIILPMVNGQRGNPVLFSRGAIESILAHADLVCRTYMDKYPEKVQMLETQNHAFVQDVDYPEDAVKLGLQLSSPF